MNHRAFVRRCVNSTEQRCGNQNCNKQKYSNNHLMSLYWNTIAFTFIA